MRTPRGSLNSFPVTGDFIVLNIAYSKCVTGWESWAKLRFHSDRTQFSLWGSLYTLLFGFSLRFTRTILVLLVFISH
jgi:hypothetical protein